ncbi:MAG: hypothetical protein GXP46_06655 [Deferribacteres bacterium]|nr:hypothetical protein [Deferribacteres bacterium]
MVLVTIDALKKSSDFVENIRWDVTPKIFFEPGNEPVDVTHGYMLYVDIINDRPALAIMQLKRIMSKTVAYLDDIPEELLKEAMQCSTTECIGGMYPLGDKLTEWLREELGLS